MIHFYKFPQYLTATSCQQRRLHNHDRNRAKRSYSRTPRISEKNICRLLILQNKVYLHKLVWIEIFPWVDNFFFLWRLVHWQLFFCSDKGIFCQRWLDSQKSCISWYLGLKVLSSCECVPRMRFSWTNRFILQTRQPSMCLQGGAVSCHMKAFLEQYQWFILKVFVLFQLGSRTVQSLTKDKQSNKRWKEADAKNVTSSRQQTTTETKTWQWWQLSAAGFFSTPFSSSTNLTWAF